MTSYLTEKFREIKESFSQRNKAVIQRGISYLFERYLGDYTSLNHKQLEWRTSWSKQELQVKDIELKPKAVNDALKDLPCEVVEGYVGCLSASIPWLELNTNPTCIHIKDVDITLRPKAPTNKAAQLLEAMSASMIHSMDSSLRFVEETLSHEASGGNAGDYADPSARNQAVTWMAEQIEKIKGMVHAVVENITVRLEMVEDDKVMGMEIHIDRLEYFDDQVLKAEEGSEADASPLLAWLTKNVQVMGITVSLDNEPVPCFSGTVPDSTGTSPPELYVSALEEALEGEGKGDHYHEQDDREPPRAIPVPIATIAGRSDIKVKMKSKETVEGPKIDASTHFGAFHALMSPKQLEYLIKILSSFAMPPEEVSESRKAGALNRRMGPEDYACIGQVLEHDMRSGQFEDVTEPFIEDCNYLATGDPMFHTMETGAAANMELSMSSLDSASTLSTIPYHQSSETEQRRKEKAAKKTRERAARTANEPSTDRSRYQLTMATVSVCLLHEELQEQGGQEWVKKMQALSDTYFQGLRHISTAGQMLSLTELRDKISEIVPRDHLGLLCKPVAVSMSERTVRSVQTFQVDAKIHQAELVECLFGSSPQGTCFHDAPPVRIPQYCEILTFSNANPGAEMECGTSIPFTLDHRTSAIHVQANINSKTGPYGYTYKETKVKVDLGNLVTEVDITLQDRLSTLLTTLGGPKPSASSCSQPLVDMDRQFNEAMEDVMQSSNALDFDLSCQHVTARIRFPIPDLRPPNQHAPREWWGRNLHKESLLLEIEQVSLLKYSSPEEPSSTPSCLELMCNKLQVYFQEDFNKTPRLFGSILQGSGDVGDNFNRPRVVIKSFPPVGTSLMDTQEENDMERSSGGLGSLHSNDPMFTRPGSTPFALKREILHGSQPFEKDDHTGFDSMWERVSPGTKDEILKFMDVATSNTSLLVDITAPKVLVVLHDKQFLELLYNRINNDLLLWQPQSPSPPEAFASGQSLNIQPQYLNPDSMKSCYESNDSDSEEEFTSTSQHQTQQHNTSVRQPSDICLSVNIGEGKVYACVPLKEEDDKQREGVHGELALLAREASLFVSVGHEGNRDMRYVTIGANRAQLLHAGCVENSRPPVLMEHLDSLTFESKGYFEHMHSRIIRSEPTVPVAPLTEVGTGEGSEDMVAVAIRIKVDNWNNNKYFLVAAGIRGATLQHEKHLSGESWVQQVMELVTLRDYPIEGYVMPEVLTDLNIGLLGCAVDYRQSNSGRIADRERKRPKNFELMPMRSLLTVQKFNLAVNLNMETKYTTMKFLFDEVDLWLSNKDIAEVNMDQDYLRIGHVGLLEVGLRLGQALEEGAKTLLWFGNNRTEFRFCSDSCMAFVHLLDHFINDRDLARLDVDATAQAEEVQNVNLDERTEAQNLHVEESIADALQEQKTPMASPHDSPVKEGSSRPLYFVPQEPVEQQQQHVSLPEAGATQVPDVTADIADAMVEIDEEEFLVVGTAEKNTKAEKSKTWKTKAEATEEGGPAVQMVTQRPHFKESIGDVIRSETKVTADDLKTPHGWPVPEFKCILRELNLEICIYDGRDFGPKKGDKEERKSQKPDTPYGSPKEEKKKKVQTTDEKLWRGGPNRQEDCMVKLVVSKFRLRYEKYDEAEEKSRRLVLVARKVEIEDHLAVSAFNKFIYWPDYYVSHEGSNVTCLKMMWERPDNRYSTEEVSVRLSQQDMKCHVNQSTVMFIKRFFTNLTEENSAESYKAKEREASPSPSHTPHRKKSVSAERAPIFQTEGGEPKEEQHVLVDDSLMHFEEAPSESQSKSRLDRPPRIDVEPEDNPIFFKKFVMTRRVTFTLDYTGTGSGIGGRDIKTMASTALQGMLCLEKVKLVLKPMELNRGYRGVAKLLEAVLREWEQDILTRQFASVVGGIGPISFIKTFFQGILDFIYCPWEQYNKDGRVWRGFQKGALSLKLATQTAFLDLLKKLIDSIMTCSSICFDVLSSSKNPNRIRDLSKTPKDLREGMTGAVQVFKEGISGTLHDLIRDASQQREQKGLPGAMGYIIKNMPATMCAMPVQVLSAGADQCVTGIRHEVRPDLLKEAQEKYKDLN